MMTTFHSLETLPETAVSIAAFLLAQAEPGLEGVGGLTESTLGDIGLAAVGVVASLVVGYLIGSALRHRNFDSLFVPPWKPLFREGPQQAWPISKWLGRAVMVTGLLYVLTSFWTGPEPATSSRILQVVHQIWLLAFTVLIGLAIARVVAAAVISIFNNPTVRKQLEAVFPHEAHSARKTAAAKEADAPADDGTDEGATTTPANRVRPAPSLPAEAFADTIARLVGLFIYLIVFLPVFMVAAEVWGWTATGNAAGEIWRWLLPFVGLSATILIGWFALAATAMSLCPAEYRRTVLIGTTVLAIVLLAASFNTIFAIICGISLLVIAWYTRHDLPDFFAGMYLKTKSVITVSTEVGKATVEDVQLLTSEVSCKQKPFRVRNRLILRGYLDGQTIEQSKLVPVDAADSGSSADTEKPAELIATPQSYDL